MSNPWDAGWPRQRMAHRDERLPSLFAGGKAQKSGDWLSFDDEPLAACKKGACVVCGLPLGRVVLFGATYQHATNGPPAHPRCFALTLKFCPHFQKAPWTGKRQTVAYVYAGDNPGEAVKLWMTMPPEYDPREDFGSDFSLNPRKVRALKRADCITLAKLDPLGESELGVKDLVRALTTA